jgi:hypothetical protein
MAAQPPPPRSPRAAVSHRRHPPVGPTCHPLPFPPKSLSPSLAHVSPARRRTASRPRPSLRGKPLPPLPRPWRRMAGPGPLSLARGAFPRRVAAPRPLPPSRRGWPRRPQRARPPRPRRAARLPCPVAAWLPCPGPLGRRPWRARTRPSLPRRARSRRPGTPAARLSRPLGPRPRATQPRPLGSLPHPGAAGHGVARPRRARPSAAQLGARPGALMARGLELGRRARGASAPGAAPLPARGTQRGSFAARQRGLARARARMVHAVLWHGSPCPCRARLPLDVPVYPPPSFILCVVITLFISMKWKLNSEIDYIRYFM